ncbi:hypothetical protein SLS64_011398 [Diaporthe eres]|uniref:Uncharacterized protein n=1 Tax=Diaporthe eres TaxID=83184 RepID=A0ABR1NX92_DIAER
MADEVAVQKMVDHVVKGFGRIDYAVNSAGLGNISGAITPHLKLDAFTQTVDVNIKGAVYFVRALSAAMATQDELTHVSNGRHGSTTRSLGRGSIVLLGSVMSYIAGPGMLNYTTSKHAIIGVTKSAALQNVRINREAAEAADRVRKRLRSDVVCFGSSGFHGCILTLVTWSRDLIFFNADIREPRVNRLVTAAWAPKIRSLGIEITPQTGDEAEPDALVKALRRLPNLRDVYLVVSYDEPSDEDSESDYGDEDDQDEEEDEYDVTRIKPGLRWDSLFAVNCLAEVLLRRRSGPIAHPRDDFIQELLPGLAIAEAKMQGGAQVVFFEEHAAEVKEATAFLEKHWVDVISRHVYICARNIKVHWIL